MGTTATRHSNGIQDSEHSAHHLTQTDYPALSPSLATASSGPAHHYRRRVKRCHDPGTRPAYFIGEAGQAIGQISREGAAPLVATVAGAALAFAALGYVDHGARPMPAVRTIAAAASVSMIVWL